MDFVNIFSLKLVTKLPKHIKINNNAINLIENQQSLYRLFYNPEPIKLE